MLTSTTARQPLEELGFELLRNENHLLLVKDKIAYCSFFYENNTCANSCSVTLTVASQRLLFVNLEDFGNSLKLVPIGFDELDVSHYKFIRDVYNKHCAEYVELVNTQLAKLWESDYHEYVTSMLKQAHANIGSIDDPIFFEVDTCAPIKVMNNDAYASTLLFGNKTEKKAVMRKVFSSPTYAILNIEGRGRKYVDALATNLLRCYNVD